MMANQLALLDLTTLDQYPFPAKRNQLSAAVQKGRSANDGPGRLAERFAQDWAAIRLRSHAPAHPKGNVAGTISSETGKSWLSAIPTIFSAGWSSGKIWVFRNPIGRRRNSPTSISRTMNSVF
jgi:hypothetical protein